MKVILDTGPLLDYLLIKCFEVNKWGSVDSVLRYAKSPKDKKTLKDYFNNQPNGSFKSTPSVIVELNRFARDVDNIKKFWEVSKPELIRLGVEEELVMLKDMPDEILFRFGPTDTSIVKLAKEIMGIGLLDYVLTGEKYGRSNNLYDYCRKEKIHVKDVYQILNP